MIESRELRIGNLVSVENKPYIITSGDIYNLDCYYKNYIQFYHEIPITEEWLLKFGFEKMDNTWYAHEWYNIERDERGFWLSFQTLQSSEIFNYVHQLQNLNFALTGEELKLNDK